MKEKLSKAQLVDNRYSVEQCPRLPMKGKKEKKTEPFYFNIS